MALAGRYFERLISLAFFWMLVIAFGVKFDEFDLESTASRTTGVFSPT